MGTEIKVTLWSTGSNNGKAAVAAAMAEMNRIDATLSPYIETSELALVNRKAAASPIMISAELTHLIDRSLFFSQLSKGAFDITFASIGWHYDYREKKQPTKALHKELLPAINYRNLKLDRDKQILAYDHKNVRIDLGGIAKGHAVDNAIDIIKSYGVKHATVSAGGDSKLLGDKLGRPWLIGIKNPRLGQRDQDNAVVLTMPLNDVAVSTSGDYERYFVDEKTGERIHHIINPKTGHSAKGIMSVTILGPKSLDSDALSTTVFVMGVEKGINMINTLPEFDCVVIDSKGKVHYSKGLMAP